MQTTRHKCGIALIIAAVAVPLALVSVAFACGRLTTLAVNPHRTASGATVSVFGRNYNTAPTASLVTLHWNSRQGPVLWSGRPAPTGSVDATFKLPRARAGDYVIMATQNTPAGVPAPGTPGRAAITIGKKRRRTSRAAAAWAPLRNGDSGGSGPRVSGQTGLLAALLSAGLLSGGLILLRRRSAGAAPTA